jgi:hypothetical protein
MGKTTIKRVGVLSAGKIMGAIAAVFGFIIVAIVLLFSLLGALIGGALSDGGFGGALVGGGIGVFFSILLWVAYTVFGFIIGCLYALIYNVIARYVGGLEVET